MCVRRRGVNGLVGVSEAGGHPDLLVWGSNRKGPVDAGGVGKGQPPWAARSV